MTGVNDPALLELEGISKYYSGVTALDSVNFACAGGTIHAILGENGAGKSTLIKIISGVVRPDSGTVKLDGQPIAFDNPLEANAAGIVCVFQELSLLPQLSIADNICITRTSNRFGWIDRKAQRRRAEELLARVGCEDLNPLQWVGNLPLSRQQMVEIAKALGRDPRLLILDEATSALTSNDVQKVYEILRKLRDDGLSLLYISHRMHEIKALADVCSVFRNGRHISTFEQQEKSDSEIVQLMIGREISNAFPGKPKAAPGTRAMLRVDNLSWAGQLKKLSFSVGRGEVVGVGGLDGQGQRALLLALFGVLRDVSGTMALDGQAVKLGSPARAKRLSSNVALVPEDRKTEGLFMPMSIRENMSIAALYQLNRGLVVDTAAEAARIGEMVGKLRIKVGDLAEPVATLSGGNQQKVIIAKWLMTGAKIILLNDPTRGIDVGTKQEIYQLLRDLADAGTSILFYTTDYDELIGCCDRVLIMYQGEFVRTLEGDDINETNIISSSLNLPEAAPHPGEQAPAP